MRRRKVAVIVSVCSAAVVLSFLFFYFSEFPFFHQSDVMTVGQLNTGINYWRSFYVGRTVTVRGTLETFISPDGGRECPYNGMLVDDNLNASVPVNLNWTECSSLLGTDVIVKGVILDSGSHIYIRAEYVASVLINAF